MARRFKLGEPGAMEIAQELSESQRLANEVINAIRNIIQSGGDEISLREAFDDLIAERKRGTAIEKRLVAFVVDE